ncbi:hypothetical protein A0O28_0070910 [Trichoderma guizhouense]|uniref:Ankyrin repeat protein n=1 Tax=Trichoderma guizhouense TaxID=1491466 RepID=A0A1T3D100_9HYPO|nr:hypothetical protein A0O28_0070910 [Trichoderma guizhouense]
MPTPLHMRFLRNHFDSEDEVLHACIRDEDLQRLQQLLSASPAPDVQYNSYGFGPPVHFASWCGNLEAVEMLLAAGADPLLVSEGGEEQLIAIAFAAARGHRDIVKRLWGFCPPEVYVRRGRRYSSCFIMAANHGHAAIVEDLLDWWDGWPHELKCRALHGAALQWRLAVASLLLRRTSFDQSTLQEALRVATYPRALVSDGDNGHREAIDFLNQQLMVELLIDAGADPNECPNNAPPLIYDVAADANLTGVLKSLLEKGADPNKVERSGLDVNAINANGWTPLMCALIPIDRRYYRSKSPIEAMQAAQFLLSHGADTGTVTEEGLTPLHVLSLHRDKDVNGKVADLTRKLISRGVNPEARARLLSPDSKTIAPCLGLPWGHRIRGVMTTHNMVIQPALAPLYWAAQRGAVGVIKALLAHGVDVSSMDDQGISTTRMAANSKFLERQPELVETIIGLLLAAGAGF